MWRVAVLLVLIAAACGGDDDTTAVGAGGGDGDTVYEADATVLESPEHGPELCLGGVAGSYPPQCGGIPITNWDWDLAPESESANGTTWGSYHVVGTYDGEAFTLTEDPGPLRQATFDEGADRLTSPCPEPDGGWQVTDPERATQEHVGPAAEHAAAQEGYAGLWLSWLVEPSEESAQEPGSVVLNVAFTGDVDEHEADLRDLWGGPLCVVEHERTEAELRNIQEELADELDAQVSSVDVVRNRVEVQVTVVEPGLQDELDDRYGEGAVVVHGALRPRD